MLAKRIWFQRLPEILDISQLGRHLPRPISREGGPFRVDKKHLTRPGIFVTAEVTENLMEEGITRCRCRV